MIFNELAHDSTILARPACQKISAFPTTFFVSQRDVRVVLTAATALHRAIGHAAALRHRPDQHCAAGLALAVQTTKNKYIADLHIIRLFMGMAYND